MTVAWAVYTKRGRLVEVFRKRRHALGWLASVWCRDFDGSLKKVAVTPTSQ